jgi:hypothetical protein
MLLPGDRILQLIYPDSVAILLTFLPTIFANVFESH